MHSIRTSFTEASWRRKAFAVAILVTLGVFGFVGVVLFQPQLVAGILGQETATAIHGHFSTLNHRIHDFTFTFLFGTAVVGILVQLWTPSKNITGQVMALIPLVALVLTFPLTNTWVPFPLVVLLGTPTLIATLLHPAWRDLVRSFSASQVNWVMLGLVIIAAVLLLAFASTNIGLQETLTNGHATLGHYGFMAAFSFTIIGIGLLASLRFDGWWLSAWITGILPVLLGLVSVMYPNVESSLSLLWALAAIAWGIVFIAVAELTQDAETPTLLGAWGEPSKQTGGDRA